MTPCLDLPEVHYSWLDTGMVGLVEMVGTMVRLDWSGWKLVDERADCMPVCDHTKATVVSPVNSLTHFRTHLLMFEPP
jgi:hypothetical protein